MNHKMHRRTFIKTGTQAGLAAGLIATGIPAMAQVSGWTHGQIGYTQQPLPYGYASLEPIIDGTTMNIHYTKHAAGYTKNLSDACMAEKVDTATTSLEQLLRGISRYSTKMRNNAGGHFNH
ncbi:MAG: hypothetical protein ACK5BO_11065 [Bacteroidota bacterium]